jgi:streptogramin lyase
MAKERACALITTIAIVAIGLAMPVMSPRIASADLNGVLLTGGVKSDSGQKMEGVTVSVKGEGQTITTTVFTDEQGNYYFPPLPNGKYRVWAQAQGYEAGRREVEVTGAVRHQDFLLKSTKDFAMQLDGDGWIAALPEDSPEHRKMKDVFFDNCTGCHIASYPLQNRFDENGWIAIINLMSRVTGPEGFYGGPDMTPWPFLDYYKKELAAYLAEMRGPAPSPMKFKALPRPKGEATLAVFVEYDVPVDDDGGYGAPANDGSDWSLGTASRNNGNRGIHDAQFDLDGNIWFAYTEPSYDRTVGKVDAKTGKLTNIKVPGANGMAASSHGITVDQQGILWFNAVPGAYYGQGVDSVGGLARLDPKTEKVEVFKVPQGMSGVGGTLDVDGKGNIWAATRIGAIRFDTKTGEFTEFRSVTSTSPNGRTDTYGVTGDREGNGWWTQFKIDLVDRGDVLSGRSEEIKMPPRKSRSDGLLSADERAIYALGVPQDNLSVPWAQGPRRLDADKNGDVVWMCDYWGNNLAKIDTHSMKVTLYAVPTPEAGPYDAVVDKSHHVWVNLTQAGRLARFDPKTKQWTEYALPSLGSETRHVSILERNGKLQVGLPYSRISKVARMELRTPAELQALRVEVQEMARNQ